MYGQIRNIMRNGQCAPFLQAQLCLQLAVPERAAPERVAATGQRWTLAPLHSRLLVLYRVGAAHLAQMQAQLLRSRPCVLHADRDAAVLVHCRARMMHVPAAGRSVYGQARPEYLASDLQGTLLSCFSARLQHEQVAAFLCMAVPAAWGGTLNVADGDLPLDRWSDDLLATRSRRAVAHQHHSRMDAASCLLVWRALHHSAWSAGVPELASAQRCARAHACSGMERRKLALQPAQGLRARALATWA